MSWLGITTVEIEIEKIIVNLLQEYLDLPNDYGTDSKGNTIPCIVIRGQNVKLYNTPHLQITVSTVSSNIFASNKELYTGTDDDGNEVLYEKVMINENRQMQIDCYSRNNEARERFWEVQASLNSTLAEQLMDEYQFRIFRVSNSFNLSGLEGGSDINRYTIRFNCITWNTKTREIDYYEQFPTNLQDDKNLNTDFTVEIEE